MSAGSAGAPRLVQATAARGVGQRPQRATLVLALGLGAALVGVARLAVRMAPTDAELAAIVLDKAGSIDARRALHALIARQTQRNRPIEGFDEVIARLAPADRAFLADYRPDLLRRGQGEPR